MSEPIYITLPPGRLVMGDAYRANDKDQQGRPLRNARGEPKVNFFVGIAIPKWLPNPQMGGQLGPNAEWDAVWAAMVAKGQADMPGLWNRQDFAWKVVDGDLKYADRPECVGHWIVRASTGFAPKIINTANQEILEPNALRRGFYVRAYVSVEGNGDSSKPGLYVSHTMLQLIGYGPEIVSGPSAAQVFGGAYQLPPGASATPVAPAAPMPAATGYPPQGQPAYPPQGQPPAPGYPPQGYGQPAPQAAPQAPYAPQPAPGYPPQPVAPGAPLAAPGQTPPGYASAPAMPGAPGMPGAPPAATAYPSNPPAPYPQILTPQGQQPAAPGYPPQPGYPPVR